MKTIRPQAQLPLRIRNLNTLDAMTFTRSISLISLLTAVAGCASTGYEGGSIHIEDARLAADIKTCCDNLNSALRTVSSIESNKLSLFSATTPHFDFGYGLAPFAIFKPTTSARVLQVYSPMRLQGILRGGNGQAHYADSEVIFVGDSGSRIDARPTLIGQRYYGSGMRALFKTFAIPSGTREIILTTNAKNNRQTDLSRVLGDYHDKLFVETQQEFRFAGIIPNGYHLSTYGPIALQIFD